jgi:hypothetical protein
VESHDLIFAASGSEELLVHAADIANMPPAHDLVSDLHWLLWRVQGSRLP